MLNFISQAIAKFFSFFKSLQVKQFLPIVLIGFLLLNISAAPSRRETQQVIKKLDQTVHQEDSTRPKTTGEWEQQYRETEGRPVERIKRIGEQSAEAVKDFGSMYVDTAKRSAKALDD
ncbi:MAG: hypothetical protein LH649_16310 [Pseudanabaena sp. CAN_BIN31]|nr:hypothetical protein [Pseudanabaena sp. CAN_BIN31]